MTEIFRKSGKKYCSKLLRPGDTFLIKLLSPQRVNDLGVIGKVLASTFEWYVNCQHPESLKISLASLVYTDQCWKMCSGGKSILSLSIIGLFMMLLGLPARHQLLS